MQSHCTESWLELVDHNSHQSLSCAIQVMKLAAYGPYHLIFMLNI
jgi:hypothetical protein